MSALSNLTSLAGWKGYAVAFAVGALIIGGAAWKAQGWRYSGQLAELRRHQAQDDLAVAREAIKQTNDNLLAMAASARAAATVGPELTASIGALSKALKNANPLPASCRPDADRVRNLTDAVRAARGAATR